MTRKHWKCLLEENTFCFSFFPKQNKILIENDKHWDSRTELRQTEAHLPTVVNVHVAPNKTQLMSIKIEEGGILRLNRIRWQTFPLIKKWQRFGACMNYWWGTHGVLGSGVVFTKVNQPWVMSLTGTATHLRMIKLPPHQLQTINL